MTEPAQIQEFRKRRDRHIRENTKWEEHPIEIEVDHDDVGVLIAALMHARTIAQSKASKLNIEALTLQLAMAYNRIDHELYGDPA